VRFPQGFLVRPAAVGPASPASYGTRASPGRERVANALMDRLTRFAEPAFAILRVVAGLAWMFHGVQKIFGVMTDHAPAVGSQLWIGGLIELVCGALVAIGLFTRPAAFLASGTMAVAYIQFHWKGALDARFFPAINEGELSLIYCFLFLFVACAGAGRISVDHLIRRGRGSAVVQDPHALEPVR
jgi:putative oxidoreductase